MHLVATPEGFQASSQQSIHQIHQFFSCRVEYLQMWPSSGLRSSLHSGPQGGAFLTSLVVWKLKNTNHFRVICKYLCYISLIIFLDESDWNQRQLQLKVIKGNFLSSLADTAAVRAPRNSPAFLNPSIVTLLLSGTKLVTGSTHCSFSFVGKAKTWPDVWEIFI